MGGPPVVCGMAADWNGWLRLVMFMLEGLERLPTPEYCGDEA